MSDTHQKIDLLGKVATTFSIILGLAVTLSGVSFFISLVIIFYVVGLLVYLIWPWKFWAWNPNDDNGKSDKKLLKNWYIGLLTVILIILITCSFGAFSVKRLPQSVDNMLVDGMEDASKSSILAGQMIQANVIRTNLTITSKSVVGIVDGQKAQLMPTKTIIKNILKPFLFEMGNFAVGMAGIIMIGVAFLFTGQKYVMGRKKS